MFEDVTQYPLLKHGDTDDNRKDLFVTLWQSLMRSQGFYTGRVDGFFGSRTTSATRYFQMTHLDSSGVQLVVSGDVDGATWWAGHNPSGAAQRSHIEAHIPAGISADRRNILAVALKEHALGTCEIPDGSNWGDGVTKFLKGVGPNYWCCYFVWWVWYEVFKGWLWGQRHGGVQTVWRIGKANGTAQVKGKYTPVPGDFFVLLYKNKYGNWTGTGHIGFVLSVAPDGQSFNTIEGNTGNRVKVGLRSLTEETLVGFINPYGDDQSEIKYERKLLPVAATSTTGTR